MTNIIKERSEYWKKRREDYIKKVRDEYKIKEARGMTEEKTYKCPLCGSEHKIDKYDWIDSCIGYIDLSLIEIYEEKWLLERMKKNGKRK